MVAEPGGNTFWQMVWCFPSFAARGDHFPHLAHTPLCQIVLAIYFLFPLTDSSICQKYRHIKEIWSYYQSGIQLWFVAILYHIGPGETLEVKADRCASWGRLLAFYYAVVR